MRASPDQTLEQIEAAAGLSGLKKNVAMMLSAGELTASTIKRDDVVVRVFRLNAAFKPKRAAKGGEASRETRSKRPAKKQTKKARVDEASVCSGDTMRALTSAAVIADAAHLAETIRDQVESIDSCAPLAHALSNFDRARALHEAAQTLK